MRYKAYNSLICIINKVQVMLCLRFEIFRFFMILYPSIYFATEMIMNDNQVRMQTNSSKLLFSTFKLSLKTFAATLFTYYSIEWFILTSSYQRANWTTRVSALWQFAHLTALIDRTTSAINYLMLILTLFYSRNLFFF